MERFSETSASEEIQTPGWDAITAAFETLYPGQENPLHFASAFPWSLGGPNLRSFGFVLKRIQRPGIQRLWL